MDEDEGLFGYELSGDDLRATIALPTEARIAYFVEKCAESGQVWTIGQSEELIVLSGEDDTPFVVAFPHPEFGQDWFETTDLEDVELVSLGTEDWVREVLPGLSEAEIQVLIFPTSEESGGLVSAADAGKLFADLESVGEES